MKESSLVLFSRILRWSLGIMFISAGIYYLKDGGWPAIFFGLIMLITGFFRPRRCIDDSCDMAERS
jgi:hypothetical protein